MRLSMLKNAKAVDGAPAEFQIFPYGRIGIEGEQDAILDDESMDAIIAGFERRGNDMVIDYEHQTLMGTQAPAAGWIRRLINKGKDGLWAVVDWTEKAREYLAKREYRYFSPVFWTRNKDRKIVGIQNVALTNEPLLNNLRPIVAKMTLDEAKAEQEQRAKKYNIGIKDGGHVTKPSEWENVPDDQFLDPVNYRYPCPDADQARAAASYWGQEKNQEQYTQGERSIINERLAKIEKHFQIGEYREEAKMLERLKKLLGLDDKAGEDLVIAKVEELKNQKPKEVVAKEVIQALELKESDSVSTVVASIHAIKQAGKGAVSREEFDRLQNELKLRDATEIVAKAIADHKITPEQKDWATEYAKRDLEGFKTFITKAVVVIPIDKLPEQHLKVEDIIADAAVMNVAKMFGNTAEDIKKYGGLN